MPAVLERFSMRVCTRTCVACEVMPCLAAHYSYRRCTHGRGVRGYVMPGSAIEFNAASSWCCAGRTRPRCQSPSFVPDIFWSLRPMCLAEQQPAFFPSKLQQVTTVFVLSMAAAALLLGAHTRMRARTHAHARARAAQQVGCRCTDGGEHAGELCARMPCLHPTRYTTTAPPHARTHARTLARTHARTHARSHARTLARTHARSLAPTHVHGMPVRS